jgi:hypothetical protein
LLEQFRGTRETAIGDRNERAQFAILELRLILDAFNQLGKQLCAPTRVQILEAFDQLGKQLRAPIGVVKQTLQRTEDSHFGSHVEVNRAA